MKKLLSLLIITLLCVVGCSSNDENVETPTEQKKKEYTMAEFSDMLEPLYDNVREKSEFLTEDEIDMLGDLFYKTAKEMGLPVGERIVLRGKVHDVSEKDGIVAVSISAKTKDDDYKYADDIPVWCEIGNYPEAVFLKENEVVVIEGVFLKENDIDSMMLDCKLISPTIDVPSFNNNISEILDDVFETYSDYSDMFLYYEPDNEINGIVTAKVDISTDKLKNETKEALGNNEDIDAYIDMADYMYELSDEKNESAVYVFCNNDDISISDKLYVKSTCMATICEQENERIALVFCCATYDTVYVYKD